MTLDATEHIDTLFWPGTARPTFVARLPASLGVEDGPVEDERLSLGRIFLDTQ